MSSNTSADLALEYFKIGNAVVAFYVVQTLLFLNAIYKESSLLTILSQNTKLAYCVTWGIAIIYISVVVGCLLIEALLRYSISDVRVIQVSTYVAGAGRVAVISLLAWGCSWLITILKDMPANIH
jgi:hypothetical protein